MPIAHEVYKVGTRVVKTSGYSFPGEVRAAYTTISGQLRYVIEAVIPTGECEGMQHIFNPEQIIAVGRQDSALSMRQVLELAEQRAAHLSPAVKAEQGEAHFQREPSGAVVDPETTPRR